MMMMRPLGSLLLLTCGLLLSNQHANAVTELTDANFFDYAKDKDVLLVDFYAPWCSDCKALDPDFENAASNLGTRSVDLAKVDCFGAGKGLCSTYGVKQWPTLKNFNRGQYTGDYTGGLSTAEIAGYITTVENSVHPVVNPYAAPYTPQASAVVTQQCVAKCKISRISNKQPCYARCKPKSYGKKPILPQPVINEKSCAKCRQPAIAGKFSPRKPATTTATRRTDSLVGDQDGRNALVGAQDGRNAFVLTQKVNNDLNLPIKPAPAGEEEALNSSTLALLPGGFRDAVKDLNSSHSRDITGTVDFPQPKTPKHPQPIERQFNQPQPLIISPSLSPSLSNTSKKELTPLDSSSPENTTASNFDNNTLSDSDDLRRDNFHNNTPSDSDDVRTDNFHNNTPSDSDDVPTDNFHNNTPSYSDNLLPGNFHNNTPSYSDDLRTGNFHNNTPSYSNDLRTGNFHNNTPSYGDNLLTGNIHNNTPSYGDDVRAGIVGVHGNELAKTDEPETELKVNSSNNDGHLHARIFEVINNGKAPQPKAKAPVPKANTSFRGAGSKPGSNVMMSIVQHNATRGRELNLHEKSLRPEMVKPLPTDRNAVVLLELLTPEDAIKVPYDATDKKKNVAKHKKMPEIVVFRKNVVHRKKNSHE